MDFAQCPVCNDNLNVATGGHLWCVRCGKDLERLEEDAAGFEDRIAAAAVALRRRYIGIERSAA